jgi:hypothetical protein
MDHPMNNVQKTMLALAARGTFPQGDKDYWIKLWSDAGRVEQMITHIANCVGTRDEDMGRLVHMMEDHIAKDLK